MKPETTLRRMIKNPMLFEKDINKLAVLLNKNRQQQHLATLAWELLNKIAMQPNGKALLDQLDRLI